MINRGRYNDLHLYEVTEQDLLLPTDIASHYHAGNVLIFADKRMVELGHELARADDMATACEYLENSESLMYEHMQTLEQRIRELTTTVEQRDELLRDVSEELRYERDMAALLQKRLDETETSLKIQELSRDEMVDDLQQVSVDIRAVEMELDRIRGEKVELEQELAARIADLVDLNFQNDDLKRQLGEPSALPLRNAHDAATDAGFVGEAACLEAEAEAEAETGFAHLEGYTKPASRQDSKQSSRQSSRPGSKEDSGQVVTVSSGKQIHVYHEFSAPPTRPFRTSFSLASRTMLRTMVILLVVVVLFVALSTIATARLNDLSIGEALDSLVGMF